MLVLARPNVPTPDLSSNGYDTQNVCRACRFILILIVTDPVRLKATMNYMYMYM